jgi:hypothetical protein
VAALEGAPRLEELGAVGLRGGHAGDVEEFELANVVPGEDGLLAGDLVEEVDAGGDAGGRGEADLRIVEPAEEARVLEDGVVVRGEPRLAFSGVGPLVEQRGEVGGLDGEQRILRHVGAERWGRDGRLRGADLVCDGDAGGEDQESECGGPGFHWLSSW